MSSNYSQYPGLPPLDGQDDDEQYGRSSSARPWPPVPPAATSGGTYVPGGQADPWGLSSAGGAGALSSGLTSQQPAVTQQTSSWAAVSANVERSLPSSGLPAGARPHDTSARPDDLWSEDGNLIEACTFEYDRISRELDELRVLLEQSGKELDKLNHRKVLTAARVREMEEHLEMHSRQEIRDAYLFAAEAEMRAFMIGEQREQMDAKMHTYDQYARFLRRAIQVVQTPPIPAPADQPWVAADPPPAAQDAPVWPALPDIPTTALVNPAASSVVSHSAVLPTLSGQMDVVARVIQAQEGIRERVAQRLHDGPTQSLANVVLTAEVCEKLVQSDPRRALSELGNLKGLVNAALQETRKFIFELRPMTLDDLGLVATLRRYTTDIAAKYQIQIPLSAPQGERRMPKDTEVAVFRVAQEAIVNAVEHSRASVVQVMAAWPADGFVLVVEDNGSGFNVEQALARAVNHQTIGIASMQERAEIVGGWLKIESTLGRGTRIELSIPTSPTQPNKTFGLMQRY